MSASYLLLKENKQDALSQSTSNNQTLEWSVSDVLILTLILFSINVLFKLIEKLLDYLREKFHACHSKTHTAHNEAKENSSSESSKDPQ